MMPSNILETDPMSRKDWEIKADKYLREIIGVLDNKDLAL